MLHQSAIDTFGDLLKHWRKARRFSQMELALTANVSTRHLSFVETGRSKPGYDLVLRLAEVLSLSLQHTNALLVAAGYAPRYSAWSLDDDKTGMVRAALERMLMQHEPYPALVTTRHYDLIMVNNGTRLLVGWLTGDENVMSRFSNSYQLLFASNGLRPYLANFDLLKRMMLRRLYEESITYQSEALFRLYESCLGETMVSEVAQSTAPDSQLPIMTLGLRKGDLEARFFSTITSFGTAIDVTTQELRIECFFPADDLTQHLIQRVLG
ncbi:MAG: helix-turn-helix transcriptional regulator [Anaerolineae bacterium]|nr:helix-turn-helix transcriptional regulator [Anaerolineae bacterium]